MVVTDSRLRFDQNRDGEQSQLASWAEVENKDFKRLALPTEYKEDR
jgi:hypothetical protein